MCGWVLLSMTSSKSFFDFGLLFLLELRKLQCKSYADNNYSFFKKPMWCLDEKITNVSDKVLHLE